MRATKLMSGLSSGVALAVLALTPLFASAATTTTTGPGTSSSNLTTVSDGYAATSTGNAEAQTNAEFTVSPGSLTLNQVPNIALGSVSVKSIATGSPNLPLVAGNTTGGAGYDGNGNSDVNVTDYRGDHAGWTLTVGMGPFTSGTATVSSASLALDVSKGATDNTSTSAPMTLNLTQGTTTSGWISSPQTVWNADANTGEGSNTATAEPTSSLTLGKQPTITAGTYDATLYWALQNAPAAAPASSTTTP
ncbi:WxL domain-containing protein [Lactiplantibacillus daowaiensis]|uniref:WxL domain-containing protein n=1 Tax=Lactiplantibacillus daowaiensis TaxID=2559918 RepID=A0ABW1RX78_9LACO|nr:WxL domain-containing protein [Lactiplantibacillus daowaiensis]